MLLQGWTPGSPLGSKSVIHSDRELNTSNLKILVKDDNRGLGAILGGKCDETQITGLDVFQSILGRLNGKSEVELKEEQKSQKDQKRAMFVQKRWQFDYFVSGGFLADHGPCDLRDTSTMIPLCCTEESSEYPEHDDSRVMRKFSITPKFTAHRDASGISEKEGVRITKLDVGQVSVKTTEPKAQLLTDKPQITDPARALGLTGLADTASALSKHFDDQQGLAWAKKKIQREETKVKMLSSTRLLHESTPLTKFTHLEGLAAQSALLGADQLIHRGARPLSGRHAVRQRYIKHKKMAIMDKKALNEVSGIL